MCKHHKELFAQKKIKLQKTMTATKNYMVLKMTNKFQYFHMASKMEKDDGRIGILNIVSSKLLCSKDTKLHYQTQYYFLGENNT